MTTQVYLATTPPIVSVIENSLAVFGTTRDPRMWWHVDWWQRRVFGPNFVWELWAQPSLWVGDPSATWWGSAAQLHGVPLGASPCLSLWLPGGMCMQSLGTPCKEINSMREEQGITGSSKLQHKIIYKIEKFHTLDPRFSGPNGAETSPDSEKVWITQMCICYAIKIK